MSFLIPTLRIPPRWKTLWEQDEAPAYIIGARAFFAFFLVVYVLHYYWVDIPLRKEPLSLWAQYRFSCAGLAALGLGLTFLKRLTDSRQAKIPLALVGLYFGVMQAESMVWRAEIPYVYALILPAFSAIALRTSILGSVCYLIVAYLLEYRGWSIRPHEFSYMLSAAMVALVGVATFRSRMTAEVNAFLAERQRIDTQKKVIEKELELNQQIRAFLPKVIYDRFHQQVTTQKKTALQAIDEVLRGRRTLVACLYSDIRNFTSRSKKFGSFVQDSVVPNMRACTDIVELHDGVPRLIGDLVFAYFDVTPAIQSLRNAVQCGIAMIDKSDDMSSRLPSEERITRHVILSFGEAFVGNTGGSEGSREITVLGRPANLLARVDTLTKEPQLRGYLKSSSLILTEGAAEVLFEVSRSFMLEAIDLSSIGLSIPDFAEEKRLFLMPLNEHNRVLAGNEDPILATRGNVA